MYRKICTILELKEEDLNEFSIQFESLIQEITSALEVNEDTKDDDASCGGGWTYVRQSLHPAYELFIGMLFKLNKAESAVCLDDRDSIWHTELLENILKQGKEIFKKTTPGVDIDHVKYAWTYCLDTPYEFGVISKSDYQNLIKYQEELVKSDLDSLKDKEYIGTPKQEVALLNTLKDTFNLDNISDELTTNRNNKNILVFFESEVEDYDDDY